MIAACAVGLLALGVVGWLSYRSTKALIAANQRLVQAHKIVEDLTALHVLLDDAESSCRGYALSGKTNYLEPYNQALAQLDVTLQILRHDLAPDRARSRQLQELEPVIQARLVAMKDLVQARAVSGFEAAVRMVQSDRGKRLSDEIRKRITRVQGEERNDLLERERDSSQRARNTIVAVALTCSLGIGLLLLAFAFIYRLSRQSESDHRALEQAERIQRTILNSAAASMISIDSGGAIRTMNAKAEEFLQYNSTELIGRNVAGIHDRNELQARGEQLSLAMGIRVPSGFRALLTKARYGIADQFECTYVRKDGTRFPVLLSISALRNGSDDQVGYLMIATDLTERHAIEKMKDEFVSVVSHELRTPLTSIKGALGLLAGGVTGALPSKASEMVRIAITNADRLSRLVDDILDLQRIESGRITMDMRPCEVDSLMRECAEAVRVLAENERVKVAFTSLQASINADQERMVQVFVNLLVNAIKFSPRGSQIEFAAERVNGSLVFRVKDEGRGIPRDKLESIFEKFQQVDASDAREKGGTGLGLAICRSIVQQHGGRVWAESETGRGSTFYVRLPLSKIETFAVG